MDNPKIYIAIKKIFQHSYGGFNYSSVTSYDG